MKTWLQTILPALLFICSTFIFCPINSSFAGQVEKPINQQIFKKILAKQGIQAEAVILERNDGFSKGIYIQKEDMLPLLISCNADAGLFLISMNGEDNILLLHDDGNTELIQGNAIDIGFILCMFDAVLTLVNDINTCEDEVCMAKALLSVIMKVMNCGEPAAS